MMRPCERCGERAEQARVKLFEVQLRDESTHHLALCRSCADPWDTAEPGEWVTLPSTEEEDALEVLRLYWPCDFCASIVRYDGIAVRVSEKGAEWIVCEECQPKHPELRPLSTAGPT
jgi:protein-arginine kinase activator protein McsA